VKGVAQILYRLQSLDSELSEQLSKLREAEALLGETAELRAARRALKKANQELATCGTRLRSTEMDLQGVNERIAVTRERLYSGRVTNPKELSSLQQDLQYTDRSRQKLEDDVLTTMVLLEDCEKALGTATDRLADVDKAWQEQQASLHARIEQLQAQIAGLQGQRAEVAGRLSAGDLALYEDLKRQKGGRAVALLTTGMCQGCRVTVSTSKDQLVRRGTELITCTNCGRILTAEA
jgi:predicted  nucleic acid-binding Zn-ribbon protein